MQPHVLVTTHNVMSHHCLEEHTLSQLRRQQHNAEGACKPVHEGREGALASTWR